MAGTLPTTPATVCRPSRVVNRQCECPFVSRLTFADSRHTVRAMETREDPGHRVARLRVDAGLTQTQLAADAGLSLRSVQHVEAWRKGFRVETMQRIARALGVSVSAILEG